MTSVSTLVFTLLILCEYLKVAADSKVVCYLPDWYGDKDRGDWVFGSSDVKKYIDPNLCTHIHLAFAALSNDGTNIVLNKGDDAFLKALKSLRKSSSGPKILLSLGGWSDDNAPNKRFSKMVASSDSRAAFIKNAEGFVKDNGLDGLDVDWEYPNCWHGDCQHKKDKENFAKFIKELSVAFHDSKLLVSAAVSADGDTIDEAYDVPTISDSLDYINVMCYDYAEEDKTGLNAPLDKSKASMQYWKAAGAKPSKLVMGIPLYGKTYTLKSSSDHGVGAPVSGKGSGTFVDNYDTPYFQICLNLKDKGWTSATDSQGPYAYRTKDKQWVGYDSPSSVANKAQYAKKQGYGGVMVWDLGSEDFRGECCGVKFPLMNSMNRALGRGGSDSSGCK